MIRSFLKGHDKMQSGAERIRSPLVNFNHVTDPHFVTFSSSLYTTIRNPNPNLTLIVQLTLILSLTLTLTVTLGNRNRWSADIVWPYAYWSANCRRPDPPRRSAPLLILSRAVFEWFQASFINIIKQMLKSEVHLLGLIATFKVS